MFFNKDKIDTSNFKSREEVVKLLPQKSIGIELGVAEGKFSEKLLQNPCFYYLYGVDQYAGDRGHDDNEYLQALKLTEKYNDKYTLIRSSFDKALNLFEDEYFDFIYIDGYAHTGQDEGKTLGDWYPKLKKGGIFSGDDYSKRWPKNFEVVNEFANSHSLKIHVINDWNSHRTWVCRKI